MEVSKKEIPFLDVLVKLKRDPSNSTRLNVSTDIYHKPTDTFNYFPFDSCAPNHIPRNIPYNLARRIALIVSNRVVRDVRLEELRPRLLAQKYPLELINDSIRKAKTYNREELLNTKKKEKDTDNIPLVLDYNPTIKDPSLKIKDTFKNLELLDKISNGQINMPNMIVARRQPPSLLRQLSLSIFRDHDIKIDHNQPKYTKCDSNKCIFCTIVISDDSYTTKNGTVLTRNQAMSCKSMDLLYVLICNNCKEEYVGETGVAINERTNLHRSQIITEEYRNLKVSKHIHRCGNNEFQIFPFHKCYKQCHIYREEMESHYRSIIEPKLH